MYQRVDAQTFRQLADALAQRTKVSVRIYAGGTAWGHSVAKRLQGIFIEDAKNNGSSPMSASFDGFEGTDDENWYIYNFSLTDIQNKTLIHHVQLTRFKEDEV